MRCHGCGCELPPKRGRPQKWCSNACEHRANRHRRAEQRDWEAEFGSLLREIAPDGLTDQCPARRGALVMGPDWRA